MGREVRVAAHRFEWSGWSGGCSVWLRRQCSVMRSYFEVMWWERVGWERVVWTGEVEGVEDGEAGFGDEALVAGEFGVDGDEDGGGGGRGRGDGANRCGGLRPWLCRKGGWERWFEGVLVRAAGGCWWERCEGRFQWNKYVFQVECSNVKIGFANRPNSY